ncbi:SDR family oxidoreductase [Seleniivibrio sp.]|uniref:NAD-dependent epimerase/dehydratase family protein n=1 Tax=Seleniivibrio sp. TaxID=2898801 RepID=UPI0025D82268|nr:SDR family oxidoreductase [Seleniivibrio sp.]MCD8554287.1 SDR family oxidoreductase [Seleniivibrio sp.]
MENILVTGACGFKGTVLTEKLLNAGYGVTAVDTMWFGNFLPDHPKLRTIKANILKTEVLPLEGIDTIIHLANIANDPCGDLNSKLSWEVNCLALMNMLEKAIACGVKKFIYASSGSVYGVKEEEQVTEELSLVPISDYNKTKMIAERVLMSYSDRIQTVIIRPATVCGYSPRMRLDVSVNMLTMQALTNGRITVFGGKQVRPNIHIQDITDVYLFMMNEGKNLTGVYNAGFENISILDIAETVTKYVPAEIVVTESNDPRSYRLNSDKLLKTGFKPKYSIAKAIEEIIEAYRSGKLKDAPDWYNIKTMKRMVEENRDLFV